MTSTVAADILIDALAFYLTAAGVTEDDRPVIERAAQELLRLIGAVGRRAPARTPELIADGVGVPPAAGSDYEAGWDTYSRRWDHSVRTDASQHLGDEWGVPGLTDEIVDRYVKPHLSSDDTVLEIGCGGGKYSERLAPLCRSLVCGDVSEDMLRRAAARLERRDNVRFETLNGLDLGQFASDSIDFVFSFDCFVHIDLEDIYGYLLEIRRVLRPDGVGVLHMANFNSDHGFAKFVAEAPLNRGYRKTFDRFRFLTWEIVQRLMEAVGFQIIDHRREPWRDILVVFAKAAPALPAGLPGA